MATPNFLQKYFFKKTSLWLVFCFLSLDTQADIDWQKALVTAKQARLSQQRSWLRLGHYPCDGCDSRQDGKEFFLSPEGKHNPQAELIATIESFAQNPLRKFARDLPEQRVICQFPARLTWLARELNLGDIEPLLSSCDRFKEFYHQFGKEKVSLVFSSYYMNNPSSAFGHTLLKINRSSPAVSPSADILAHGINYAALPTTTNPVLYAILGMVGGFKGGFAFLPYYYKIREYNDFESRDLWEYDLDLTDDEVDLLIKHIWELGFADFDYYYFTENCSYYMIDLLDVAAPRLHLTNLVPFWVIPNDTVKAVAEVPGLIKKTHFRPSTATVLQKRFDQLDGAEREVFFHAVEDEQLPERISAKVLDAIIDHFDVHYAEQLLNKDERVVTNKHRLLVKRSQLPEKPEQLDFSEFRSPHEAHDSWQGILSFGQRDDVDTIGFSVRFGLHDLVDPTIGMPPTTRLEMVSGSVFFETQGDKKLKVDRFRLVGIESLNSWTRLWKKLAWRFDLGGERVQDQRCMDCLTGVVSGGIGLAKTLSFVTPFVYLNLGVRTGKFANHDLSPEFGPSVGLRFLLPKDFNILTELEKRFYWQPALKEVDIGKITLQKMFTRRWGLRGQFHYAEDWYDGRLGVVIFD